MSDDDDDLFASLGGSLMKDLLADSAVDDGEDGWMSLEELERELAHLDQRSRGLANLPAVPEAPSPSTAASMVVANQARGGAHAYAAADTTTPTTSTAGINNPAVDAWSLSFQKFSAAALEQDFLQADSARKQQQQQKSQPPQPPPPPPPGLPPGLDLTSIKDYNVSETAKVAPPPGMTGSARANEGQGEQIISQAAAKLMEQLQQQALEPEGTEQDQVQTPPSLKEVPPPPKIPKPTMPPTPQNSMSLGPDGTPMPLPGSGTMGFAPTPPPSASGTPQVMPSMAQGMVALPTVAGGQQAVALGSIPVAVPLAPPPGGSAWQSPLRPIVPIAPRLQPRPVYCNPHPRAPPIPATALASKYMTSRDIGYVVHGILRHLQTAGASSIDDYDVQYWVRRNGKAAEQAVLQRRTATTSSSSDEVITPNEKREQKAREWSSAQKTLGHVAKSSVSRPRALIAQPVPETSTSESSKQRAALWKARIYVDQAYQAFMKVIDLLKTSPPGQVPPVQPYLRKLLKCMGLQKVKEDEQQQQLQPQADHHHEYVVVDEQAMKLLLKLDKGKILMSRVLEQALLPPKAVQAALPVLLRVLCQNPPTSTSSPTAMDDPADSRLFGILSRIIQTLPQLSPESLLESLGAVEQQSAAALSTTARMQCVHALLQRGGQAAATDTDFQEKWTKMEDTFLQILAAM